MAKELVLCRQGRRDTFKSRLLPNVSINLQKKTGTRSLFKVLQLIWGLWKWILGSFQIFYFIMCCLYFGTWVGAHCESESSGCFASTICIYISMLLVKVDPFSWQIFVILFQGGVDFLTRWLQFEFPFSELGNLTGAPVLVWKVCTTPLMILDQLSFSLI